MIILKEYRKQIYGFLVLFSICFLQATLLNYFRVFGVKPDIILIALVTFVSFFSFRWSITFAFLAGIFRDIFTALPFGFNTIICVIWVVLVKQISRRLTVEDKLISYSMPCLIILLNSLALQSMLFILGKPIVLGIFSKVLILEFIFTLLLAFPIYRLFVNLFSDTRQPQLF